MPNLEFSVPYNNDPATLTELFKLKSLNGNRIREVYLSGPQQYSASGRIVEEMDEEKFTGLLSRIHAEGFRANLVMNPTCEGLVWYESQAINDKLSFVIRMHKEYGLEAVTVANPLYVAGIRKAVPDIEITASVLAEIDCVQRAVIFAKAGANVITPDANINRNLKLLSQIKKATRCELKLMVNEGCLYKCPYRKFHFNYISHKSKELGPIEGDAFFANCTHVTSEEHAQILKSPWIRPEDLGRYGGITSYFKIVGRERPKSHVLRSVLAYMKESYDGDLLDIICSSLNRYALDTGASLDNKSLSRCGFFERVTSCGQDCTDCRYCEELARKLVRLQVLTRGKLEDLGQREMADQLERQGII